MVDKKFRINTNTDRCFQGRLGCQGIRTGSLWSKKEQEYHINLLELLAIEFAYVTFSKMMNFKSVHIQVDN